MHRRNRGVFAAVALAAALVMVAPGAGALPDVGIGVAGDAWARVAKWWAGLFAASDAAPNLDPDGTEASPRLDPNGAQAAPNLDPDGESEAAPNLDPNG